MAIPTVLALPELHEGILCHLDMLFVYTQLGTISSTRRLCRTYATPSHRQMGGPGRNANTIPNAATYSTDRLMAKRIEAEYKRIVYVGRAAIPARQYKDTIQATPCNTLSRLHYSPPRLTWLLPGCHATKILAL